MPIRNKSFLSNCIFLYSLKTGIFVFVFDNFKVLAKTITQSKSFPINFSFQLKACTCKSTNCTSNKASVIIIYHYLFISMDAWQLCGEKNAKEMSFYSVNITWAQTIIFKTYLKNEMVMFNSMFKDIVSRQSSGMNCNVIKSENIFVLLKCIIFLDKVAIILGFLAFLITYVYLRYVTSKNTT